MHKVFLSLGSNMGNKQENLDKAVDILEKNLDIHSVKVSSYYVTDPVGYLDQDVFMNIAVKLETDLEAMKVLELCQSIEETLHRKRIIRWGPRTLDVDIVIYGDIVSDDEVLTLPHPRMHERGFVLVPLMELDNKLIINGVSINEMIKNVDVSGVRKYTNG